MNTLRPEFQEAFIKCCFDRGLPEETALELFRAAHVEDLLANDADFRAGWEGEMAKAASLLGDAGAFVPQPSKQTAGTAGSAIGGTAGVAGGLALGAKALKSAMPGKLKALIGLGAPLLGGIGGAAGGKKLGEAAGRPGMPGGPGAAGPYLPDALRPAIGAPATAAPRTNNSLLTVPGAGINAHMPDAAQTQGQQMIQQSYGDISRLNTDLEAARTQHQTALNTPGLAGSTQATEIQRRIQDLEKQKAALLHSSNTFLGTMRRQQGESLRSIDSAHADALAARAAREPSANAMDRWLRGDNNNVFRKLFNRLFNVEGQASQMNSQQTNLTDYINNLGKQRGQVEQMMVPQ